MSTNLQRLNKLRVLVLNSTYEPLKFQDWITTIHNLYEGVAVAVEETHDGKTIYARSAHQEFVIPSVIRLKEYAKIPHDKVAPYTPQNVYIRDNWQCQLQVRDVCTAKTKGALKHQRRTIDHVISQYYGGGTNFENCVAACYACNQYKKYHLSLKPKTKPRTPSWLSIYNKKYIKSAAGPSEWTQWLGN